MYESSLRIVFVVLYFMDLVHLHCFVKHTDNTAATLLISPKWLWFSGAVFVGLISLIEKGF